MRLSRCFVVFLTCLCVTGGEPPKAAIAPEVQRVLDDIQAAPLRDDLKFIASDELQGRDSPSPGLDRAADYIAAQFRRAGLEPGNGDNYFQTASMMVEEPNFSNFQLKISNDGRQLSANQKDVALSVPAAVDLQDEPIFKIDLSDEGLVQHLTASQVQDKVVITEIEPRFRARMGQVNRILHDAKPTLVILVQRRAAISYGRAKRRLVEATKESDSAVDSPRVSISGEMADRFYTALKSGDSGATATVRIAAPHRTPAAMRNVIGVLRGSDPALRDTCVLLTAHYDHLGVRADGKIYYGANDDGSGTVSVIEIARALAQLPQHPRRSIVFMTFFGEEEGLIGSEYYVHHPVWPLEKTVADLNLEQVGRTDSTDGRQMSDASLTGFDYSDITDFVQRAGQSTGIRIYKNLMGSDNYFGASDNFSFAAAGVPAETLTVAFDYPDYHAVGDEWQKVDYDNMAKVDRAIALATYLMADSEQPVHWNEANPKTAPYLKAGKQRGIE